VATLEQTTPPVALRADAARNRELIVDAAAGLFAEKGLDVSTSEIAARAGVGEATLFRRFPVKQDLVDAVLERKMRESIEAMAEYAAEPDPWRGIERLFIETIGKKLQTDLGFMEAAGERCMTCEAFSPMRGEALELTGQILGRAQEAGVVRDDLQPQDIQFLVMSAAASLRSHVPGLRDDLWKRYARVILDGLRPECASKLSPAAPPRKLFERPAGS
jgi:AcrR family transcriptional regulator